MKQNIFASIFIVCFACFGFGQTYSALSFSAFVKQYSAVLEAQPKSNFSVKTATKMYKDIQDNELVKNETGFLIQGNGTYQLYKSESVNHIQNDEIRIEIDSSQKTIIGSFPMDLVKGQSNMDFLLNVDSTNYTFSKMEDKKHLYFRVIEIQQVSTNKEIILRFLKSGKQLSQINIYYWPANYFSNDLNDEINEQPRLIVDYSEYSTLAQANEVIQKELNTWLFKKDKSYQLAATRTNYKFNDLRAIPPSK